MIYTAEEHGANILITDGDDKPVKFLISFNDETGLGTAYVETNGKIRKDSLRKAVYLSEFSVYSISSNGKRTLLTRRTK